MDARAAVGWSDRVRLADGRTVLIRRAVHGDQSRIQTFVQHLSSASRYQRFFLAARDAPQWLLDRLVEPDARHVAAVLALDEQGASDPIVVGLAQYDVLTPAEAEAAVVVGEDWRRIGLARRLLSDLELIAAAAGVYDVRADVLRGNAAALTLALGLGCTLTTNFSTPHTLRVAKHIVPAPMRERLHERGSALAVDYLAGAR